MPEKSRQRLKEKHLTGCTKKSRGEIVQRSTQSPVDKGHGENMCFCGNRPHQQGNLIASYLCANLSQSHACRLKGPRLTQTVTSADGIKGLQKKLTAVCLVDCQCTGVAGQSGCNLEVCVRTYQYRCYGAGSIWTDINSIQLQQETFSRSPLSEINKFY